MEGMRNNEEKKSLVYFFGLYNIIQSLTLYHKTNLRLVQIESICRQKNKCE